MAISHANCTHPRTPAGRRACRAGNAPALTPANLVPVPAPVEVKMTGAVARRMARHAAAADRVRAVSDEIRDNARNARAVESARQKAAAAPRIQGRNIPTRVRRNGAGCVQAALHTSGRCACGWHAANFCNPEIWACAGH